MKQWGGNMQTSQNGIDLIKRFEGCRLTAYKPVAAEQYYTIGYGHYGPDVKKGQTITQAQAEALLKTDLTRYEGYVKQYAKFGMNQNQFDALVSFCYNCGAGSLQTLVKNRPPATVAEKMLLYNKGAGGVVLSGLTKRRQAERELFLTSTEEEKKEMDITQSKVKKLPVIIDGKTLQIDGIFDAGSNYVSIRQLAQAMGAKVSNQGSTPVITTK